MVNLDTGIISDMNLERSACNRLVIGGVEGVERAIPCCRGAASAIPADTISSATNNPAMSFILLWTIFFSWLLHAIFTLKRYF